MSQNSKDSALSQISSISEESNFISDAQNLKITKEIKKVQLLSSTNNKLQKPSKHKPQQKQTKIKVPLHRSVDLQTLKQIFLEAQNLISGQNCSSPPALSNANRC